MSFAILSKIAFTNEPESFVPYFLASSMASLMTTFLGAVDFVSSKAATLNTHRSVVGILAMDQFFECFSIVLFRNVRLSNTPCVNVRIT